MLWLFTMLLQLHSQMEACQIWTWDFNQHKTPVFCIVVENASGVKGHLTLAPSASPVPNNRGPRRGPRAAGPRRVNSNSLDLPPSGLHLFSPFAFHVYSRLFVAQISGLRAISALPRTEINCRDADRVSRGAYNRYRCRVDVIKNPMPDMAAGLPPKRPVTCASLHTRPCSHAALAWSNACWSGDDAAMNSVCVIMSQWNLWMSVGQSLSVCCHSRGFLLHLHSRVFPRSFSCVVWFIRKEFLGFCK